MPYRSGSRVSSLLTFDPLAHRYEWDGKPVLNVTRVLEPVSRIGMIDPDVLETAREKGVAVHLMVELDCAGTLDEDSLPEWMAPALLQWRKFREETGFRVFTSERRVYHRVYRFAGTLDLYGRAEHAGTLAFIDVKRSFLAGAAIGLQLSAYQHAYSNQEQDRDALKAKRFALRLNEKDAYRVEQYTDESQFQDFLTLLNYQRVKDKYTP